MDTDRTLCGSWVKAMNTIIDMSCQVQKKDNEEIGVIPPYRYL